MTIKEDDRKRYQTIVSDFQPQHEPDSCFPTSIKNVLDELADRKENPDFRHSIGDISDAIGYERGRASPSNFLSDRIDPLIEDTNWEVCYMSGLDYDQLETIIASDDYSLPICELHQRYFKDISQYTNKYVPELGIDGTGKWKHTVIPFKINDAEVLYFDPYILFFNGQDSKDKKGIEVPANVFNEWWERPVKRWAMWFEPKPQHTLLDYTE